MSIVQSRIVQVFSTVLIDRLLIEIVNAIAMPESFYPPSFINLVSCDGESVTLHATPVLCDIVLAVLLRIGGI